MADRGPRPVLGYRLLVRALVPVAGRLLSHDAAARGHRGRLDAATRLAHWSTQQRDTDRPLAWFHAASVGESLQAAAVIDAFRQLHPEWQVVATHFSASAERVASQMGADFVGYAPYDRRADVERSLEALGPRLLVFTKLDVWPELTTAAARRGIATALVAGTVDAKSSRRRWPARAIARPGYRALTRVAAISDDDAHRLVELGVAADRVSTEGDPRVDSVLQWAAAAPVDHPADPHLLVAGSTWPDDEAVLLEAFAAVRTSHPTARLWLVPHQPSDVARAAIAARAASLGLPEPEDRAGEGPLGVVSEMGVLARLYGLGGAAYVGGGFGGRGVHSVLEPAARGVPIIIGPHDRGLRDAALLAAAGGLVHLPVTHPAAALAAHWNTWLRNPAEARARGAAARAVLERDRGAARRSAEVVA
jgi:3-deoxy-D-manno-octulosonic-acid transferase